MATTLKNFTSSASHVPAPIIRGVVRQLGGWNDDTRQNLRDIAKHGIGAGFHGFIYYVDTVAFFKRHRKAIMILADETAREFGHVGALELFASFNCMKGYSQDEVARAVYTGKGESVDQILNCIAWYVGETVARAFDDMEHN